MPLKSVIPGRRKAASPESMNTELSQLKRTGRDSAVRVHGFRAWPFGPSRNDRVWVWAVVNVIALSAVAVAYLALPGPALERSRHLSGLVLARDGSILRGFLSAEGKWRLTAIADSVDPLYRKMLLAAEDQRFATHPGIDALAVLRAFGQLASHGRIVSGASTLSMQVVRLLERRPRSLAAKAVEAAEALSLERHLAKEAILGLYLTLAPFGGNLEGVRAASLAYFGKEPNHQSPAEAALLVALPRAPERLRPDRHPEAARHARDAVLERMRDKGILSDTAVAEARAEAISRQRFALPFHAPHLARALRSEAPGLTVQQTTIDPLRQRQVEALLLRETTALDPQATLAALVIDNRERQVVAYIGNPEFGSTARHGTLDLARAVRPPGSALEAFVHAMAFDRLIIHPQTVLDDRPRHFGDYAPSDFDGRFLGEVSAADALRYSLNVPAVAVLDHLGPGRFTSALAAAGIRLHLPKAEAEPGLAIALGGAGISLHDLATLYVALARGGAIAPLRTRPDDPPPQAADAARKEGGPRILYPPDGAVVAWDGASVPLEATGKGPLRWLVDGRPVPPPMPRRPLYWQPAELGFVQLTVIDAKGHS